MKRTLNEVYRICQKAAEGAGVPAGLDSDAAQNTVWLVARGFAVLETLACELERARAGNAYCFSADEITADTLDASTKPGALLAPALVDLLIARAEGQAGQLAASGLSSPLYLLPAAMRYAREDWCFRFDLRSPRGERFRLNINSKGASILGPAESAITVLVGNTGFELDACCAREAGVLPTGASQLVVLIANDTLAEIEANSLANSIKAEPVEWERLHKLAVKILVPATEESRARGAGAKTDDNE